jgi:hypothetical protein
MLRHLLAFALLAASFILSPQARAQGTKKKAAGPDSTTPAGVVKLVQVELNRLRKDYEKAGRSLKDDTVSAAFQKDLEAFIQRHTARFDIRKLDPSQLKDLATLFSYARDEKSEMAVMLRRTEVGTREDRADAIGQLLERNAWRTKKYVQDKPPELQVAVIDTVRGYLNRLDAMGTRAAFERARGRVALYNALKETDSAANVKNYPSEAMQLLKEVPPATRRKNGYGISSIYASYIEVLKQKGDTAAAEALRLEGIAEFKETGQAGQLIQMAVIDKPCPALVATHWFNAPPGFAEIKPQGKVTLVMLTAHW